MGTSTLIAESVPGWAPGSNLYETSDGRYFMVMVPPPPPAVPRIRFGRVGGIGKIEPIPTVIVECFNAQGETYSMDTIYRFAPGVTHEEALAEAGFPLVEEEIE